MAFYALQAEGRRFEPVNPHKSKSRNRGISRLCTLYILFTPKELTSITLGILPMFRTDFLNTTDTRKGFQQLEYRGF